MDVSTNLAPVRRTTPRKRSTQCGSIRSSSSACCASRGGVSPRSGRSSDHLVLFRTPSMSRNMITMRGVSQSIIIRTNEWVTKLCIWLCHQIVLVDLSVRVRHLAVLVDRQLGGIRTAIRSTCCQMPDAILSGMRTMLQIPMTVYKATKK